MRSGRRRQGAGLWGRRRQLGSTTAGQVHLDQRRPGLLAPGAPVEAEAAADAALPCRCWLLAPNSGQRRRHRRRRERCCRRLLQWACDQALAGRMRCCSRGASVWRQGRCSRAPGPSHPQEQQRHPQRRQLQQQQQRRQQHQRKQKPRRRQLCILHPPGRGPTLTRFAAASVAAVPVAGCAAGSAAPAAPQGCPARPPAGAALGTIGSAAWRHAHGACGSCGWSPARAGGARAGAVGRGVVGNQTDKP